MDEYPKPFVTVDILLFTVLNNTLKGLFIERKNPPYQGCWAIPGGFVEIDESLDTAAFRELHEETNVEGIFLEQVYTYGGLNRDPRGRTITVLYSAVISSDKVNIKADTDASRAEWINIKDLKELAFDHKMILDYTLTRLKEKSLYTPILFQVLPNNFILEDLKTSYKALFSDTSNLNFMLEKAIYNNIITTNGSDKGYYKFNTDKINWINETVFSLY